MDGSEYQKTAYGKVEGRIPDVDLALEVKLQARLRAAIEARLLKSAHDCSDGGLAVALAECCVFSGSNGGTVTVDPTAQAGRGRFLGAEVDLGSAAAVTGAAGRPDLALFGEAPTRVVVTCAADKVAELETVLGDLPHRTVGRVAGADLRCTMEDKELFAVPVSELHSAYESLPERLA